MSNAHFFANTQYVFSSLHTWEWITIIVSIIQLTAGFSPMAAGAFGRIIRILGAALSPGSAGIVAIYDRAQTNSVNMTLANAVRNSVAQFDGADAKNSKARALRRKLGWAADGSLDQRSRVAGKSSVSPVSGHPARRSASLTTPCSR